MHLFPVTYFCVFSPPVLLFWASKVLNAVSNFAVLYASVLISARSLSCYNNFKVLMRAPAVVDVC